MPQTVSGKLRVQDSAGKTRILLNGNNGGIHAGKNLEGGGSKETIHLNSERGNLALGGNGQSGDVALFGETDAKGKPITKTTDFGKARIRLDAEHASIRAGGANMGGDISLRQPDGTETVRLDGFFGLLQLGAKGQDGMIIVKDKAGHDTIIIAAQRGGDIIIGSADCAEDFDIADGAEAEPGTVMIIDEEYKLRPSAQPYDRRVAGVMAGAGDYRPAIILDRKVPRPNRRALSLLGKVFCKADADHAAIEVGDLLTTSLTPGHAMKALEPEKAFGAVIGKALRPLRAGTGLIPILIALQ